MQLPATLDLPLRTERLLLRPFQPDDLEALLTFHSDPVAVRYVPFAPRDRSTMASVLERKIANTELGRDGDLLELAVVIAESQTLIGDVLLALRSRQHQTLEVGYLFSPAYGGRGLATEAVHALIGAGFSALGARRIIARVDARNTSSHALLKRLGLRQEAHLVENEWFKGELGTEVDYAVLSREWPTATRP